ncbi:MAG: transcriptional regulator [Nocardioidaceae bacterium]|nr:transcriptional regulator [Nocardioidaceae bacterium]
MTPQRRWFLVGVGVLLLIAIPVAVRSLPATESDVTAADLLAKVQASGSVRYSGYAEAVGGLQLPVTDRFSDLATLLGERTRLRVWWRSPESWRVDAIGLTGETDLIRDLGGLATWEYEAARVTFTADAPVRLPRTADLVPAVLGRQLLGEAESDEVARLPAERVAGRDVPGLRLTPRDPQTTIDHVDAWVDPQTGLVLRVEVYGAGTSPVMSTSFRSLSTEAPALSEGTFTPPPGAEVRVEEAVDIAAAADQFAPVRPPGTLVGLDRRPSEGVGAVGDYGRGVTRLVAIPLWDDAADPLRDQLETTPGARVGRRGTVVTVGPLGLMLTPNRFETPNWLLAGTVSRQTLARAAAELEGAARVLQ